MMKIPLIILGILSLICVVSCKVSSHDLHNYKFEDYMKDFNKTYHSHEYAYKKHNFEINLASVIEFNSREGITYKKGINAKSDTNQSYIPNLPLKRGQNSSPKNFNFLRQEFPTFDKNQLPKSVDWRNMSTPVKNQDECQGCWAFSTVETIETHLRISSGQLIELSEQELISCMQYNRTCYQCGGCHSDDPEEAYKYVVKNGLTSEQLYPYKQLDDNTLPCIFNQEYMGKAVQIEGYRKVENVTTDELMFILANYGPVTAAVDMLIWDFYKSGVFSCANQEFVSLNHAISIEGYGTDEQFGDYWIVRNSFTDQWGEGGYMRLKKEQSLNCKPAQPEWDFVDGEMVPIYVPPSCGECGVQTVILYPIGVTLQQTNNVTSFV